MSNSTREMSTKVGHVVAILARGTMPDTVRENRFELVKIVAWNIRMHIHDHTSHSLAFAMTHQASLRPLEREALFGGDERHATRDSAACTAEFLATRECEIIRIPRVTGSTGCRETREPAVEAIGDQIGQRG